MNAIAILFWHFVWEKCTAWHAVTAFQRGAWEREKLINAIWESS
ncbi:MAG: hypothetical protein WCK96_07240 [Methylococcales bacterium]